MGWGVFFEGDPYSFLAMIHRFQLSFIRSSTVTFFGVLAGVATGFFVMSGLACRALRSCSSANAERWSVFAGSGGVTDALPGSADSLAAIVDGSTGCNVSADGCCTGGGTDAVGDAGVSDDMNIQAPTAANIRRVPAAAITGTGRPDLRS